MTLRARLTLFFVGIVVVPLLVAGFLLRAVVSGEVERRTNTRLQGAALAVGALWDERVARAEQEVAVAARALGATADDDELARERGRASLDFLVLARRDGTVIASAVEPPAFASDGPDPSPAALVAEDPPPGVLRSQVDVVSGRESATLAGGWFADERLAESFAEVTGLDVVVLQGGRVLATTAEPPPSIPTGEGIFELDEGRRGLMVPTAGTEGGIALIATLDGRVPSAAIWVVAVAGLGLAVILGWALAGVIARPLVRLAEGARAVAAGNLDTRVDPVGKGDVAHLADAFNAMTANLRSYVEELESSRDELRRGLDRLGAALRATHDLPGIVRLVLETATATLRAEAGAVFLMGPTGTELRLEAARGYRPPEGAALPVGHGIAGRSATGVMVRVPGALPIEAAAPVEPPFRTAIAVPLTPRDRAIGVLAVYGCSVPEAFTEEDTRTLRSLAAQAAVAVENVLLHQEAQRMSVTDSLTGVSNRRSLQATLAKEVDRSQRFGRPLSVLLLDLDRFKRVNDEHGHRRGDEVLVEVARRVQGRIRGRIDTLARYGGEEFVIVLPETEADGARVVADKIRRAVADGPITSPTGPDVHMTVSIGTATFPGDGEMADDLLRAADTAMYRAKDEGRDRVATASDG
ncbi:MAG: diguanylate cyclase [Actinomycetota bacterium]